MIIGIDLGTTNSAVGIMTDDGPQLIANALGGNLTPSVVGIDSGGEILVGHAAKELRVLYPERCASLFKRQMGSDWTVKLNGHKYSPQELSSLVLRALKVDAETHLGEPIERAVITVPAYFNDRQRQATLDAGRIAGLSVERILNEPTAAAIAYGLHESGEEKVVVVIDLGGGTFDFSAVDLFEGAVEVRASSGECFLGGEDLTQTMSARILESQGEVFERVELKYPRLVSSLMEQCERAKCDLSVKESTVVKLPNYQGEVPPDSVQIKVSRAKFEKWTEHILARIELPIRRGLSDAGLKWSDVDEAILVGGATRMPSLRNQVRRLSGKSPQCRFDPDEVVALGAAVQAGLIDKQQSLDDLVVTDVAPFTLGTEITKQVGIEQRGGYYLPVINRNITIPVSRVERMGTVHANQTEMKIGIYQGESRRVKDNLFLGQFEVKNIPRGPAGQEVDIRFTYDLNGVLEVEATVVKTKEKVRLLIDKYAGSLTENQIQRAVEEMQKLKTHPREESVNRFILKRAERLYRELSAMDREALSLLIDAFEAAMEMQEEPLVVEHRKELEGFLDRIEKGFEGFGDEYNEFAE